MRANHKQSILKEITKRLNNAEAQVQYAESYINSITEAQKNKCAEVSIRVDNWCSMVFTSSQYDETLAQHKEGKKQAKLCLNRYKKDIAKINSGGKISKKTKDSLTTKYKKLLDMRNNIIEQFTDELEAFEYRIENNMFTEKRNQKWLEYKGQSITVGYYPRWKEERDTIVKEHETDVIILKERLEVLKTM